MREEGGREGGREGGGREGGRGSGSEWEGGEERQERNKLIGKE